jgi:hypothetical protein
MRVIEALEIAETRKLDGVELQAGGVIQKLNVFPVKIADGKSIEAQPYPVARSSSRRQRRERCGLQKRPA